MYDFINFSQGATFEMYLYCFMLYCFLVSLFFRGNVTHIYEQENNKTRTILLFCGLLLFALTSFMNGDFFHYYEFMSEYKTRVYGDQERGLEIFYQYLIYFINGNYPLFRLAVWGSSLILIVFAAQKFRVNVYHTLFIILAGYIIVFSYARATLAMAVLSVGLVLASIASLYPFFKRFRSTLVAILIIISSIYFHRSMLPIIFIAFGWILMPWKRQLSRYSLWLFPVLVAICSMILNIAFEEVFLMANTIDDQTGMLDKAEFYAEQEAVETNVNGHIRLALHYSVFFVPFVIISIFFRSTQTVRMLDNHIIWLYQAIYLLFVFATSFLFVDMDSNVLFYRYLYMTFIPLTILIVYLKDRRLLEKRHYLWMVTCFIISNLCQLFLFIYTEL